MQIQSQRIGTRSGISIPVDTAAYFWIDPRIFGDDEYILDNDTATQRAPVVDHLAEIVSNIQIVHFQEGRIVQVIIAQELRGRIPLEMGLQIIRRYIADHRTAKHIGQASIRGQELIIYIIAETGADHKTGAPFPPGHIGAETKEHVGIGRLALNCVIAIDDPVPVHIIE